MSLLRPTHVLLAASLGLCACAPGDELGATAPDASQEFRCATDNGAAIIGLDSLVLCGNVVVGGITSVDIYSNKLVHLSGSAELGGDVVVAEGGKFERSGNAISFQGEMRKIPDRIAVEPQIAEAAAAKLSNNNAALRVGNASPISSGKLKLSGKTTLRVPAGDYYFDSGIKISGQTTIILEGPARFFVNGTTKFTGTTSTSDGGPYTLEIISVSSSTVTIAGTATAKLHVSAPLAHVKMSGNSTFTGTILGRSVTISGRSRIESGGDASNYDGPCDDGGDSSSGGPPPGTGGDDLPPADGGPHDPDGDDGPPPDGNSGS
ncbi:MAG: hypothetical protein JKY37_19930 [Nannocystaceae bacterium]|nr:hypothetical protein [Nannocystaceae bacterium]